MVLRAANQTLLIAGGNHTTLSCGLVRNDTIKYAKTGLQKLQTGLEHEIKRDFQLVELSLVLTGSFRLLLTLQAGADVMLALLVLTDNALLGNAALKTTQSALQRFVLLDANFRHCFPSLRWHPANSWMRSGPITLG